MLGNLEVVFGADIKELQRGISRAKTSIKSAAQDIGSLGSNLNRAITLPLAAIGGLSIKTAADFETLRTSLETLTGSAEEGARVFDELREFSAGTPFQLKDLADATKTMLSFGISTQESAESLRMLGDVALGDANKLKSLTLAFSQIQSTGRLMGQDLLQLINAGFNPLTIISEQTGKSMAQLKKEMSEGAISADMVTEAFRIATSEGGRFFGGMEKGSKTLSGLFSTLRDNVSIALGTIGEDLIKTFDLKQVVADITERVQQIVGWFTDLSAETKRQFFIIVGVIGAGGIVISAIGALVGAIGVLIGAFQLLFSPITAIIAIFAVVVVATQSVIDNWGLMSLSVRKAMLQMTGTVLSKTQDIIGALVGLSHTGTIVGNALKLAIAASGDTIFNALSSVQSALAGTGEELARVQNQIDNTDMVGLGETAKNLGNNFKKVLGVAIDSLIEMLPDFKTELEEVKEALGEMGEEAGETARKINQELRDLGVNALTDFVDATTSAFTDALFLARNYNTQELELRKYNLEQQIAALNDSLARQEISQREYNLRIALLNNEALKVEQQINRAREGAFKRSMRELVTAAEQAVRDILAEFARLAVIRGLGSLLGLGQVSTAGQFASGLFGRIFPVDDALITSGGDIVKFHPKDNILAMKDFSGLQGGSRHIRLSGEFRIRGNELVALLEEADYELGR